MTNRIRIETDVNTSGLDKLKKTVDEIRKALSDGLGKAAKNVAKDLGEAFNVKQAREYQKVLRENTKFLEDQARAAQNASRANQQSAAYQRMASNRARFGGGGGMGAGGNGGGIGPGQVGPNGMMVAGPNNVGAGGVATPPTPPGGMGFWSHMNRQFSTAWAMQTIMGAPAAGLNALQKNSEIPFMNSMNSSDALRYSLNQMSGKDLGYARFGLKEMNIKGNYMSHVEKGSGGRGQYGIDISREIAKRNEDVEGGGFNKLKDSFKEGLSEALELKNTNSATSNALGGLAGGALGMMGGPLGMLAAPFLSTGLAKNIENRGVWNTMTDTASAAKVGINTLMGKDDALNATSGGPDVAYGNAYMRAAEASRKADPLLDMSFKHLSSTAEARDSFAMRNRGGYNWAADVGKGQHFGESESVSHVASLAESLGTSRAREQQGTMFRMMRSGLTASGSIGGLNSYDTMNGGRGLDAQAQSGAAKKDFEDLMARAFGKGIKDSQLREDIVEAVKMTATNAGGRGSDVLAQTMTRAFDPKTMDRTDLGSIKSGFEGIQNSQKSGYFHNRAMPGIIQALNKEGINDPYLAETLASLAPGEKPPEALVKRLGGDVSRAADIMASVNTTKYQNRFSSFGMPKRVREQIKGMNGNQIQNFLRNGTTDVEKTQMSEVFQYQSGGGDFLNGQGGLGYLSNVNNIGKKGKIGWSGDEAAIAAKGQEELSDKMKRDRVQRTATVTLPDGTVQRETDATLGGKAAVESLKRVGPQANGTTADIQNPQALVNNIVGGLAKLDAGLGKIIDRLNRGGFGTDVPDSN